MAEKNDKTHSHMPKNGKNSIGIKRFRIALAILCFFGIVVIGTALKTMLVERPYWEVVRDRFTKANIIDKAIRGNIYDCNNRLLVGSVPEYRLCIDFRVIDKDSIQRVKTQTWRDSAFLADLDSIVMGLHEIFPEYSEKKLRDRLLEGYNGVDKRGRRKNGWSILP